MPTNEPNAKQVLELISTKFAEFKSQNLRLEELANLVVMALLNSGRKRSPTQIDSLIAKVVERVNLPLKKEEIALANEWDGVLQAKPTPDEFDWNLLVGSTFAYFMESQQGEKGNWLIVALDKNLFDSKKNLFDSILSRYRSGELLIRGIKALMTESPKRVPLLEPGVVELIPVRKRNMSETHSAAAQLANRLFKLANQTGHTRQQNTLHALGEIAKNDNKREILVSKKAKSQFVLLQNFSGPLIRELEAKEPARWKCLQPEKKQETARNRMKSVIGILQTNQLWHEIPTTDPDGGQPITVRCVAIWNDRKPSTDESDLDEVVEGTVDATRKEEIAEHLNVCSTCRRRWVWAIAARMRRTFLQSQESKSDSGLAGQEEPPNPAQGELTSAPPDLEEAKTHRSFCSAEKPNSPSHDTKPTVVRRNYSWMSIRKLAVAACLLVFLSGGAAYYISQAQSRREIVRIWNDLGGPDAVRFMTDDAKKPFAVIGQTVAVRGFARPALIVRIELEVQPGLKSENKPLKVAKSFDDKKERPVWFDLSFQNPRDGTQRKGILTVYYHSELRDIKEPTREEVLIDCLPQGPICYADPAPLNFVWANTDTGLLQVSWRNLPRGRLPAHVWLVDKNGNAFRHDLIPNQSGETKVSISTGIVEVIIAPSMADKLSALRKDLAIIAARRIPTIRK